MNRSVTMTGKIFLIPSAPIFPGATAFKTPGRSQPSDTARRHAESTAQESAQPDDALAPVTPTSGSMNGHHRYIGSY